MAKRRNYCIETQYAIANTTKTAITITSATTIRPVIYDLDLGFSSTPADNAFAVYLQRFTAAGTAGVSYTPPPLDPGDPAATTTGGTQLSAEPTYTSAKILFHCALNQRATHRFSFDPDGGVVSPATANNGVGLYGVNASATPTMDALMYFYE